MLYSWSERDSYANYITNEVIRRLREKEVDLPIGKVDVASDVIHEAIRNVILDVHEEVS